MTSPWCSTTTCPASAITARITCSISRMVSPSARLSSRNTATIWSHSVGRKPAITSSSSSNLGRVASARATSSRLRSGRVSEEAFRCAFESRLSFFRMESAWMRAAATLRSLCSAPTMTLSSAERPAKGFTSWKVRPMPAAQTWSGRSPSILLSRSVISPLSGVWTPAIMLKMVVLPAPLGPIRATIEPSGTEKLAACTARRPRKDFDRLATASMLAVQAELLRERRPHALGQEHDHQQQARAVEHLLYARHVDAKLQHQLAHSLGEPGDEQRADQRADEGADAADDRTEDQLDRARDVEDLLGKEIVVVEREHHAGERGHRRGEDDGHHLVAEEIHAERLRRLRALADREPVVTHPAAQQRVAQHEGAHRQGEHQVIEHPRAAAQVPQVVLGVVRHRQEQARGAAHPGEVVEADARELGEGDGEDGEVHAGDAEAEREEADHGAGERAGADRGDQADPGAQAEVHVQRGGRVGAQADVERVPERELPGEAHHDVPGLADVGEVEDQEADGEQVAAREQREGEEQHEERREHGEAAARHALEQARDQAAFLPRMPCGRNSSTSTSSPKANMLFAEGVKSTPPSASVRPISRPPRSAPGIEPSPPVMTMTNASSV